MQEVSKERFFAAIRQRNVHPRAERYSSEWQMVNSRELVGRTEPGYLCRDRDGNYTSRKRYWLIDSLAQ